MKNLLVFLLVVAAIGLFFHDKQQTADLARARADNATLTDEIGKYESQVGQLEAQARQLAAQLAQETGHIQGQSQPQSQSQFNLKTDQLQDSGSLDRPAYH